MTCNYLQRDLFLTCTHSEGTYCNHDICPLILQYAHRADEDDLPEWVNKLRENKGKIDKKSSVK